MGDEDAAIAGVEDRSVLLEALEQLPERDRLVLRLRFVDGLTQSDIASRLGVSQMQISRLLASSLKRLRTNFEDLPTPNS
jgi:RNA polymerase sigma-B factor